MSPLPGGFSTSIRLLGLAAGAFLAEPSGLCVLFFITSSYGQIVKNVVISS